MHPPLEDLACIVVHHRSPQTLLATVDALIHSGVVAERILVVDNSAEATLATELRPRGIGLLQTRNRGYAAAINDGLAALDRSSGIREYTLVATHESLAEQTAVSELLAAMRSDDAIAVAGPTLVVAGQTDRTWSTGGYLSPWLKLPRHHLADDASGRVRDRDWLDGAFTLYRTAELRAHTLDELYFLYFEETDLHTRMRAAGKRVVWVPAATVSQTSSGIPPRLLGRNLFLFHSKLFSRRRGRCAVLYEAARSQARVLLARRGRWSDARQIVAGWWDAERLVTGRAPRHPYPSESAARG
ncbi:glycosyltransferase [Microbacterium sp. NPDC058021]|uniref:glycosyltransferase n=1 Tax=Microbacterium sp. NPDC058021 TaxID=3346306 RepID=UPI0036DBAD5A